MHRYVEHCQRHGLLPLLSIPVLGNPGQPEVCFWLVTTAKPKLYLKNDSAQEAVLQGSDSTPPPPPPPLKLVASWPEACSFPKMFVSTVAFYGTSWKS